MSRQGSRLGKLPEDGYSGRRGKEVGAPAGPPVPMRRARDLFSLARLSLPLSPVVSRNRRSSVLGVRVGTSAQGDSDNRDGTGFYDGLEVGPDAGVPQDPVSFRNFRSGTETGDRRSEGRPSLRRTLSRPRRGHQRPLLPKDLARSPHPAVPASLSLSILTSKRFALSFGRLSSRLFFVPKFFLYLGKPEICSRLQQKS